MSFFFTRACAGTTTRLMAKYLVKRILFSIFSLLVVVMVVMLLVYTFISRSVIFQTDDTWNKKSGNDRSIYEYTMYQKYGYLTFVDYMTFLANKYKDVPKEHLSIGASGTMETQEQIDRWVGMIKAEFPGYKVTYRPLACSIASHVGTGTQGVAAGITKRPLELPDE